MGHIGKYSELASMERDHGSEGTLVAGSRFPLRRHWLEKGGYAYHVTSWLQ